MFSTAPGENSVADACRGCPPLGWTLFLLSSGRPALEVLKEGLQDLRDLCDVLEERVEEAIPDADPDEDM